jgi:hypothetical protein
MGFFYPRVHMYIAAYRVSLNAHVPSNHRSLCNIEHAISFKGLTAAVGSRREAMIQSMHCVHCHLAGQSRIPTRNPRLFSELTMKIIVELCFCCTPATTSGARQIILFPIIQHKKLTLYRIIHHGGRKIK